MERMSGCKGEGGEDERRMLLSGKEASRFVRNRRTVRRNGLGTDLDEVERVPDVRDKIEDIGSTAILGAGDNMTAKSEDN